MSFFVLQKCIHADPMAGTEFTAADTANIGDAPCCPVCGQFVGMLPLTPPVRVNIEGWGREWGDVCFGSGTQLLFSDRARQIFLNAGSVSREQFSVAEVVRIQSHRSMPKPPTYWLTSIPASKAAIDTAASGLARENGPICSVCRLGGTIKKVSRIVLEPDTWQGEDIFIARGLPGTILVSERFERLCLDEGLLNCLPIPAEDFNFDFYPHHGGQGK